MDWLLRLRTYEKESSGRGLKFQYVVPWTTVNSFQKDAILEAQKEILSLQKGGKAKDFEIEEIPVEEVDEIYLTPYGNTIVTLKNGKPPIRAGKPNTFTDAELELLPQQHKEAALKEEEQKEAEFAKHLEEELEHIDVEEESEEEPGKKRQKKDAPRGAKKDEDEDEDEDEEEEDEEMPQAPEANTQMFKPDDGNICFFFWTYHMWAFFCLLCQSREPLAFFFFLQLTGKQNCLLR